MKFDEILLDDILYDEDFNCRGRIIPADVIELARSIEDHGLQQPVVVSQFNAGSKPYRLIAGFRRFTAYTYMSKTYEGDDNPWLRIPAVVNTSITNEVDAMILNLSENVTRQDLNIAEEARTVQKMIEQFGSSRGIIADKIKKSRGWVQTRMQLCAMGEDALEAAAVGVIKAKEIAGMYQQYYRNKETYGVEKAQAEVITTIREIKLLKEKGNKKNAAEAVINKRATKIKKHRTKGEINQMIDNICDQMPMGLYVKALAWAAGNIDTEEFENKLKEVAEKYGRVYRPMSEKL